MKYKIILVLLMLMCISTCTAAPSSFDARDKGWTTEAKNQGNTGACYVFASVAALETRILSSGGAYTDLSEQALMDGSYQSRMGMEGAKGGSVQNSLNHLTQAGAVFEKQQPWTGKDMKPDYTDDAFVRITGFDMLSFNDMASKDEIKANVMKYGSVITTMDGSIIPKSYDGKSLISGRTGKTWIPHSLIIVGWDDNKQSWLVKNSAGKNWGDDGFGWVKYGAGNIGSFATVTTGFEYVDSQDKLVYYDEAGWTKDFGYVYNLNWGHELAMFDMKWRDVVDTVEFYTTGPATVEISAYENYNDDYNFGYGGPLKNLMYSKTVEVSHAGYHSIAMRPYYGNLKSDTGRIVFVLKYTNKPGGNEYKPLALDSVGVPLSKNVLVSQNGDYFKPPGAYRGWNEERGYDGKQKADTTIRIKLYDGYHKPVSFRANVGKTTLQVGEAIKAIADRNSVAWTNSNQVVGHIDPWGVFTAVAPGTTNIKAVKDGSSNTVTITVIPVPEPEPEPVVEPEPIEPEPIVEPDPEPEPEPIVTETATGTPTPEPTKDCSREYSEMIAAKKVYDKDASDLAYWQAERKKVESGKSPRLIARFPWQRNAIDYEKKMRLQIIDTKIKAIEGMMPLHWGDYLRKLDLYNGCK